MKKEKIAEICIKAYNYLIKKGWNNTLVKILISALFGIACAYLLTACTMSYKYNGLEYQGTIFIPQVERIEK